MSAGDVVFGLVVWVVGAFCLVCALVCALGWRNLSRVLPWSRGRVRAWTSVWIDRERIVAEGVADDAIVTERFFIMLNGRPVRMVVLQIEFGGGPPRWQAQDLASYAARYRIHGIRLRGSVRA